MKYFSELPEEKCGICGRTMVPKKVTKSGDRVKYHCPRIMCRVRNWLDLQVHPHVTVIGEKTPEGWFLTPIKHPARGY